MRATGCRYSFCRWAPRWWWYDQVGVCYVCVTDRLQVNPACRQKHQTFRAANQLFSPELIRGDHSTRREYTQQRQHTLSHTQTDHTHVQINDRIIKSQLTFRFSIHRLPLIECICMLRVNSEEAWNLSSLHTLLHSPNNTHTNMQISPHKTQQIVIHTHTCKLQIIIFFSYLWLQPRPQNVTFI